MNKIKGGKGDKAKASDFDPKVLAIGIEVEFEHTNDRKLAEEIALDHLTEDPDYYRDWDNKEKVLFQRKVKKALISKLEKGRKPDAPGTIKIWGGKKYVKQTSGKWVPFQEGKAPAPKESQDEKKEDRETSKPQNKKPGPDLFAPTSGKVPKASVDLTSHKLVVLDSGKEQSVNVPAGKPSAIPMRIRANSQTNMIGGVAFGKASKQKQEMLNKMLNDVDLVVEELGVKFKKPIDFVCQSLSGTRTYAEYSPLKEEYDCSDRINLKSDKGAGKSLFHEIGHAIDYSMTDPKNKRTSRLAELRETEEFKTLQKVMLESPIYQESSGTSYKNYLLNPTELFARGFEVLAYDKTQKLIKEGKIGLEIADAFNPDMLKGGVFRFKDWPQLIEILEKEYPEKHKQIVEVQTRQKQILGNLQEKITEARKQNPNVKWHSPELATPEIEAQRRELKTVEDKLTRLKKDALGWLNARQAGLRPDAEEIQKKVVQVMTKLLKDNEIKKALTNITLLHKLEKARVVTRQGVQYYAEGPHAGREVGTVREAEQGTSAQSESLSGKVKSALQSIERGNVFGNKKLRSGKPLLVNPIDATQRGDSAEEIHEAMSQFFDAHAKTRELAQKPEALANREISKELERLSIKLKARFEAYKTAHETMGRREEKVKMQKSTTQMGGGLGDRDIVLGDFAQANRHADKEWLEKLYLGMENFNFGDAPRAFETQAGTLHLTKVDDGIYTGYFVKKDGDLEDSARVRLERLTIPELVQLMIAKEWINNPHVVPQVREVNAPEAPSEESLLEKLNEPQSPPTSEARIDRVTRVLELINKLMG